MRLNIELILSVIAGAMLFSAVAGLALFVLWD